MSFLRPAPMIMAAVAALVFIFVLYDSQRRFSSLHDPAFATGWWLFATILLLIGLNMRKKLSTVPVGRATWWLLFHIGAGILAIGLFVVHTPSRWPAGLYEQVLAGLFWVVSISGVLGYAIQKLYPRHLVNVGGETLFERVPAEINRLRDAAEAVVLASASETGSPTLGQHYLNALAWFFRKPRFLLNHALLGRRSTHWLELQSDAIERYLNDKEKTYLRQLQALALEKDRVDAHYVLQGLMKLWLLLHVPLAFAMLALACWHLVVVHVFKP